MISCTTQAWMVIQIPIYGYAARYLMCISKLWQVNISQIPNRVPPIFSPVFCGKD